MPILVERRLFRIGNGGFAVTLPKAWVRYYKLNAGDLVEIIADDDLIIRVKTEPKDEKEANIKPVI
jgi:bifunctional DNA-binding transcriptional regulator/antitoxin component of YhaV-PrlF toxin-antitoxin module